MQVQKGWIDFDFRALHCNRTRFLIALTISKFAGVQLIFRQAAVTCLPYFTSQVVFLLLFFVPQALCRFFPSCATDSNISSSKKTTHWQQLLSNTLHSVRVNWCFEVGLGFTNSTYHSWAPASYNPTNNLLKVWNMQLSIQHNKERHFLISE